MAVADHGVRAALEEQVVAAAVVVVVTAAVAVYPVVVVGFRRRRVSGSAAKTGRGWSVPGGGRGFLAVAHRKEKSLGRRTRSRVYCVRYGSPPTGPSRAKDTCSRDYWPVSGQRAVAVAGGRRS